MRALPSLRIQPIGIAVGLFIALMLGGVLARDGARGAALLGLGVFFGVALYHAAFGFSLAYRLLLTQRDTTAVIAHIVMLAIAICLFAPVLASATVWGSSVVGATAPVGWQVAIGACLFGIGMQLGGGCGSGTLFSLGGGSVRMLITLAAFCIGGFVASLHMDFWQRLPDAGEIVLGTWLGWPTAVALQLLLLLGLGAAALRWGRHQRPQQWLPAAGAWLRGPWPLLYGAAALAVLNLATLLIAGHPWSITWAFTLWAAKLAVVMGWSPAGIAYWQAPFQSHALEAPLLDDTTTVMNIGIVLGALIAASLAGRFAPSLRIGRGPLLAALSGGLLLGYGARLAYGCNIGALLSGIASSSLHGWLWWLAVIPGAYIGVKLRPLFALD